ncbi:KilA-N domain-containing protein, partial [Halomonas sp. 18H]
NQLITKQWNGKTLTFREDGYFNMTKAAKQFGKELKHFWESPDTRNYCFELSNRMGLYSAESADLSYGMAEKKKGRYGGTWAHPKLAVFFARWLDVRFAVACDARSKTHD